MPDEPENRTLMGEIDKLYRHERDMHLMLAKENAKLRAANEAWAKAGVDLEAVARDLRRQAEIDTDALAKWRALTDDLYAMWRRSMNPALRDEPQVVALDARYQEARQR